MAEDKAALELPQHVLDYLEQQQTLTLATASAGGVPRAATFLYVNRGPTMYLWVRPETITAKHVQQNPFVSLAIDEYSEDWRQTKGIQANGECGVVLDGEEIARAAFLFGGKFPTLAAGRSTVGIYFMKIVPTQLEFIDNSRGSGEKSSEEFGVDYDRETVLNVYDELPEDVEETISGELQSMEADAGEVIVGEGAPADKFFIVVEGKVDVLRDDEPVGSLGPGELHGEISIMRDTPRNSTLRAAEPTKLLAMERDTFRDVVAGSLGTTGDFDQVVRARLERLGQTE